MSPQRIQRKRTKGWRMPAGAVYVGRGTRWGNPYRVAQVGTCNVTHVASQWRNRQHWHTVWPDRQFWCFETRSLAAGRAVELFRISLERWLSTLTADARADELAELRGHDLVCWCPLDQPCHADVLLELANDSTPVHPEPD